MKHILALFIIGGLLCGPAVIQAADVTLDWKAVAGAVGYKIYMSRDLGVTWPLADVKDVGNVLVYTYLAVPEDRVILFKASAYKIGGTGEMVRNWSGGFYDYRQLPLLAPSNLSIP